MKLLVSTKRGIARRRRGGHEFTTEAQVVDVDTDAAALIVADDALNATQVADDYTPGSVPTLDTAAVVKLSAANKAKDAEIAALTAKVGELEAALAKLSPSDGSRERTGKK